MLTDLYGLQVLGGSQTSATPADGSADLRSPDECAATPIENPLLGTPEADGTPIPAWARWGEVMPLSEVPQVDPAKAVSPDVAAAIEDAIARVSGLHGRGRSATALRFFSADYYQRIRDLGMGTWTARTVRAALARSCWPGATSGSTSIRPRCRRGQTAESAASSMATRTSTSGSSRKAATWKIDEYHRIMDTSPIPEESPSPSSNRSIRHRGGAVRPGAVFRNVANRMQGRIAMRTPPDDRLPADPNHA